MGSLTAKPDRPEHDRLDHSDQAQHIGHRRVVLAHAEEDEVGRRDEVENRDISQLGRTPRACQQHRDEHVQTERRRGQHVGFRGPGTAHPGAATNAPTVKAKAVWKQGSV